MSHPLAAPYVDNGTLIGLTPEAAGAGLAATLGVLSSRHLTYREVVEPTDVAETVGVIVDFREGRRLVCHVPSLRSVARPPCKSRGASPGTSAGASLGTFRDASRGASPSHVP